jgi:hypothetical protein
VNTSETAAILYIFVRLDVLTIENTASTQSSHYTKSVKVNTKSYCDLIFKKRIKVIFYASITHSFVKYDLKGRVEVLG